MHDLTDDVSAIIQALTGQTEAETELLAAKLAYQIKRHYNVTPKPPESQGLYYSPSDGDRPENATLYSRRGGLWYRTAGSWPRIDDRDLPDDLVRLIPEKTS